MAIRKDRPSERRLSDHIRLLLDTARALSREPDLNALFSRLHELIAEQFVTWSFFIALDAGEGEMSVPFHVENGERSPEIIFVPMDETVSGTVFRSGDPMLLRTPDEFEQVKTILISPGETANPASSAIYAPLRVGDRTIGVISVQSQDAWSYDEQDLELLVAIGEQTAIAVENAHHLREIDQQRRELELLVEIGRGLASDEFSLPQMCRRIHEQLNTLVDAHVFHLALLSEDGLSLHPEYCVDGETEITIDTIPLANTLAESVIRTREPMLIAELKHDTRVQNYGTIGTTRIVPQSVIMLPLCIGESAIGIVSVQSPKKSAFDESVVRMLRSVTDQLALAINNVKLYRATEQRVDRDALTGLFNRAYALRRLSDEVDRAARRGTHVCVMMLDLDQFKAINDTYGHPVGDLAIRAMAEALREGCRNSDVICRYGGDEFLIICPDLLHPETQPLVARIRESISKRCVSLPSGTIEIEVSVGVACSNEGIDIPAIIGAADRDLYRDKARQRTSERNS